MPLSRLHPLTSLRFFAALLVFFHHLFLLRSSPAYSGFYHRFLEEGYIGVTFFFVLSGFILAYRYHAQFHSLTWSGLKKFYQARLARIYPVHFLAIFLGVPFVTATLLNEPLQSLKALAANLTLTHGFVQSTAIRSAFNSPSWSLSVEAFLYLLLPAIVCVFLRFSRRQSLVRLAALMLALYAAYLAAVLVFRNIPDSWWWLYFFPLTRLADFTLGALAALIFLRWNPNTSSKLSRRHATYVEIGGVAILTGQYAFAPLVHQSLRFSVYYLPVLILLLLIFAFQRGRLSAWLSHPELIFLGEISFSFYMVHRLVLKYFSQVYFAGSPVAAALTAFAVTAFISMIIYHYYETPLRRYLRSLSWSRRPAPARSLNPLPQTERSV